MTRWDTFLHHVQNAPPKSWLPWASLMVFYRHEPDPNRNLILTLLNDRKDYSPGVVKGLEYRCYTLANEFDQDDPSALADHLKGLYSRPGNLHFYPLGEHASRQRASPKIQHLEAKVEYWRNKAQELEAKLNQRG